MGVGLEMERECEWQWGNGSGEMHNEPCRIREPQQRLKDCTIEAFAPVHSPANLL